MREYPGRVFVFTERSNKESTRQLKQTFAQCGIDIDEIRIDFKVP